MDSLSGWVELSFLANFNRVKLLTDSPDVLLDSLMHSDVVEVDEAKKHVRRRGDWQRWVFPANSSNLSLEKTSSPMVSLKNGIEKLALNDNAHTTPIHGDLTSESSSPVVIQDDQTATTSDIAATAS